MAAITDVLRHRLGATYLRAAVWLGLMVGMGGLVLMTSASPVRAEPACLHIPDYALSRGIASAWSGTVLGRQTLGNVNVHYPLSQITIRVDHVYAADHPASLPERERAKAGGLVRLRFPECGDGSAPFMGMRVGQRYLVGHSYPLFDMSVGGFVWQLGSGGSATLLTDWYTPGYDAPAAFQDAKTLRQVLALVASDQLPPTDTGRPLVADTSGPQSPDSRPFILLAAVLGGAVWTLRHRARSRR